jgi:hypothetical protein
LIDIIFPPIRDHFFAMVRGKSWLWGHFYEPGHKYKDDKTHKAARCNYCVNGNLVDVTKEAEDELNSFQIEVLPSKQELLASGACPDLI